MQPPCGYRPRLTGVPRSAAMPRRRPPFITRKAVLPDPDMRPTDEAFDLKPANRSPYDLAFGVRLARRPPLGAHARGI